MVHPHEEGHPAGDIGPSWEGSVRKVAQRTILVADDDASIRSLLKQLLSDEGYSVVEATTGNEVVEKVKDTNPDLVIMDVRMPELDGIEALSKLKVSSPKTSVLIMTAFGSSNNAIRAMELGAFDYITKPFELDKISHTVKRVIEYRDLTSEVQVLRDEISSLVQTERIVGNSPAMQEVYKTVGKVAKADATVLITGESGTGKELVAEALHYNSNRRSGPIVKVSCAALPETLLEAELFGHEKGSFTGAPPRPLRDGRQRHDLPRRDRRNEPADADEALASAAGPQDRARGLVAPDQGRHPHHRRDEQRPAKTGRAAEVPRRPFLPAQRH